jgi:hypothetical protein
MSATPTLPPRGTRAAVPRSRLRGAWTRLRQLAGRIGAAARAANAARVPF